MSCPVDKTHHKYELHISCRKCGRFETVSFIMPCRRQKSLHAMKKVGCRKCKRNGIKIYAPMYFHCKKGMLDTWNFPRYSVTGLSLRLVNRDE